MITRVEVSKRALKNLRNVPNQVAARFLTWKRQVENHGLFEVIGYRAYYRVARGRVEGVRVEEVNLHVYKKVERLFGL